MKLKTFYICKNCSYEAPKWIGKCPDCGAWNSFVEDIINVSANKKSLSGSPRKITAKTPTPLIIGTPKNPIARLCTNIKEFDRVMGEGLMPDSVTLLSGEPGIGKSTLTLQIAGNIAKNYKVLLISGEESVEQIANRAYRLNLKEQNLEAINEYNLETILETIRQSKPAFTIIDSIQVISSADLPSQAGSITQVRYCTEQLMELAKTTKTAIMLIGHVTKDGNLAGPRVLEHLVDTVIQLEGDRFQQFRLLRSAKNRFGSCNEVGIFEMTEKGMQEVANPSKQFLEGRKKDATGSAITVAMEGTRPLLAEVQALVSTTTFGYPKRTANGFDLNRLQILIAVLEKHAKLPLQNQDVFINVVGGIRLEEPAADLAVTLAIASSLLKKPLPQNSVIFGEVGLTGELRKISHHETRLKEAKKLGFTETISPLEFKDIRNILTKLT